MSDISIKQFKITQSKPAKITFAAILALSLLAIIAVPVYLGYTSNKKASAYLDGFDPGNIMSDFVMSNKSTMTESDIQNFLKSKNPCNDTNLAKAAPYQAQGYQYTIRDGHFVCMADDTFNGETAAHIIWQAAQDYNINPQVLIVLLEKEQSLVTDTWPNNRQYAKATGFNCPDTGGCEAKDAGFKNQVRKAAALFREVLDGGYSGYPAYTSSLIYYHPNSSCGGSYVYIQNRATSALYRYTPYQPNGAALAAGTGTGDACSSYGNRNFYNLFTEWFGSTQTAYDVHGGILDGYNEVGGSRVLGQPTMNESCGLKDDGCYQTFQNGVVYWTPSIGAHTVMNGAIHDRWIALGLEWSVLGYPTGNQVATKDNGLFQQFEGGGMYYSPSTGAYENYGGIRETYSGMGFENSFLGYPIGRVGCGLIEDGCYQHYQGGSIYWTPNYNGMIIYGAIRDKWFQLGYEKSSLGYPTGAEYCYDGANCYRDFEKGTIYWYNGGISYANWGDLAQKYKEIGRNNTFMGYPTMDQQCGLVGDGCYQTLQYGNGTIYYSPSTGAHTLYGGIKAKWLETGYEWGSLGYPTSDEIPTGGSNTKQTFERGVIYWNNGVATVQYY